MRWDQMKKHGGEFGDEPITRVADKAVSAAVITIYSKVAVYCFIGALRISCSPAQRRLLDW